MGAVDGIMVGVAKGALDGVTVGRPVLVVGDGDGCQLGVADGFSVG